MNCLTFFLFFFLVIFVTIFFTPIMSSQESDPVEVESAEPSPSKAISPVIAGLFKSLLAGLEQLRSNKNNKVTFSPPLLVHGKDPVFFPNTINVIQGKAGVHKSRLAET